MFLPFQSRKMFAGSNEEFVHELMRDPIVHVFEALQPHDVVVGRDQSRSHPGNVRLRVRVGDLYRRYHYANSNAEKGAICQEILDEMALMGARFLRPFGANHWEEVTSEVARANVQSRFRYLTRESARRIRRQMRKNRIT